MVAVSGENKKRTRRNEESRNHADKNNELWSEEEVQLLTELWTPNAEELKELAEMLGRTVESCRQKYYLVTRRESIVPAQVTKSVQQLSQWSKGYTSLEDMGY